jgi:type IV pilus assembly protein PilB
MHGDPVHGSLKQLDRNANELVIQQRDGSAVAITFDQLRFLVFSHSLLPAENAGRDSVAAEQEGGAHSGKAFELLFKDGKKFHASAEIILIDSTGLHIFLDKPDGHICRVFSPKNTLKKYHFDTSLSKGLVEHRAISTDHSELGTAAAKEDNIEKAVEHEAAQVVAPAEQSEAQTVVSPPEVVDSRAKFTAPTTIEPGSMLILPPATCSSELIERFKRKWTLPSHHLGELLLAQNIITREQLHEALAYQHDHSDNRIGEVLLEKKMATADEIYSTLAFKLGLHFVKLDAFDINFTSLTYFPRDLAIRFHVIPLFIYDNQLVVAMSDPTNSDAVKMVEFVTQHRIEAVMAHREDIESAIDKYYRRREDDELIEELEEQDIVPPENDEGIIREAERQSKEKPIVRLVQNMIIEGVNRKASDIHIRPGEKNVDVIFRIDGTLVPIRNFAKSMLAAVVSRIKIIGRMDISERRIPQDGRASVNLHGNKIDLRISIMPTINGESVVIRILDVMAGLRSVDQLGFTVRDESLFRDMISHSYGVLLVTGPTGSGKSTTLYAALEHIRKTNVNIITAEDPVEYHIDGIEQMQVNHQIDYSFARILRNMLRHDPDVIMVGEIRDQETAKTAIEAALTGHLVLSTLHTNSAAVTVTRLLEMGVEPYLINDTVLGVLAQRLVRANCPDCIDVEDVAPSIYRALGVDRNEVFYRGKGCDNCNHTGYKGRLAVYELLQMNREIRSHVLKGVSADIIHAEAITGGMTALTQNAMAMARERKTSLAEVYRIRLE